ncbi:MAG: PadR family transcriptional regulator [Chloroflexi bacterium]|nr:PadR family transcriptional regulator [Chloroflexota bacterium]
MELECVLLGLISMHQGVTGYELNRIIQDSTGYLISTSLSHIYPSLKKLHDRGFVTFQDLPIKNRLSKKVYNITLVGEQALQEWLVKPVDEKVLDPKPFYLKMAFSPLMTRQTILDHIDREINRLEHYREMERDIKVEVDYLDKSKYDTKKAELLWTGINQVSKNIDSLRLAWLKEWRIKIELEIKDN